MGSALTADFDSSIQNARALTSYVAATSTVIFRGGLVQLNGSGLAIAAISSSTNKIVGRASSSLDGTEAAGSLVQVEEGDIYLNLGTATPAQANVGQTVYAENDNNVGTASAYAKAGILVGIRTNFLGVTGAIVRSTLSTT